MEQWKFVCFFFNGMIGILKAAEVMKTRSMVGTDAVGRGDLQVQMLQADAFQIIQ